MIPDTIWDIHCQQRFPCSDVLEATMIERLFVVVALSNVQNAFDAAVINSHFRQVGFTAFRNHLNQTLRNFATLQLLCQRSFIFRLMMSRTVSTGVDSTSNLESNFLLCTEWISALHKTNYDFTRNGDIFDSHISQKPSAEFIYYSLCIPDKIQPKYLYEVPFTAA